jgi:hypothetical protein
MNGRVSQAIESLGNFSRLARVRIFSPDLSIPAPPVRRLDVEGGFPPHPNDKEKDMRFMVMVKATQDSEDGVMPTQQLLEDMGRFNEELVKAGIMLAGEGLKPSRVGKRVHFDGKSRTVIDGPFSETKELVAGFWLWQCKDLDECVEWVKRCPNPMFGPSDIEIRPVFEAEDFGEEFTPQMREQEALLREKIGNRPA